MNINENSGNLSPDFIEDQPIQSSNRGIDNYFVEEFASTGSGLNTYSAYIGITLQVNNVTGALVGYTGAQVRNVRSPGSWSFTGKAWFSYKKNGNMLKVDAELEFYNPSANSGHGGYDRELLVANFSA